MFSLSSSDLDNKVYEFYVECVDSVGSNKSSSYGFTFDQSTPSFIDQSPDNTDVVVDVSAPFRVYLTDELYENHTCEFFSDGFSSSPLQNTSSSENVTVHPSFIQDGTYEWNATCRDNYGNTNTSPSWSYEVDIGPNDPQTNLPGYISEESLTITGVVDSLFETRPFDSVTVSAYDSSDNLISTNLTSNSSSVSTLANLTVYNVSSDPYKIKINTSNAPAGFELNESHFLAFWEFVKDNFTFYNITNVASQTSDVDIVTFSEELPYGDSDISINPHDDVHIFNDSHRTGWFQTTLHNLVSGELDIYIGGSRDGVAGDETSYSVFNDLNAPTIDLSSFAYFSADTNHYLINSSLPISFLINDSTQVNRSSLLVNITNSTDWYSFAVQGESTPFNTSIVNHSIDCISFGLKENCTLYPHLETGTYNVTISVNDTFNQQNTTTIQNLTVIGNTLAVTNVSVPTFTTNTTSNVSWSTPSSPFIDYFNLTIRDNGGSFLNSYAVPANQSFFMVDVDDFSYGSYLFPEVSIVDELGTTGNAVVSTEGFVFADGSAPQAVNVSIIPNKNSIYNNNDSLELFFNFSDNESGVSTYDIAVGTANVLGGVPQPGWNDTYTDQVDGSVNSLTKPLNLIEGKSYYLTVRAKSDYPYSSLWSGYTSSSYVLVDSTPPQDGFIDYDVSPQTYSSISITYNPGQDNISGIDLNSSYLCYYRSNLENGECGSFSTCTPILSADVSLGSNTYNFDVPDNDCYAFDLVVKDDAGNEKTYSRGMIQNVSVDITPPTPVSFDFDPHITHNPTFDLSWFESSDPESGIDYYSYKLTSDSQGFNQVSASIPTNGTTTQTSVTFPFSPTDLDNGETYYLKVTAYNSLGQSTSSISPSMLYFDTLVPEPLSVVQVGTDTNGSDGWKDTMYGNPNTTVLLSGEKNLADCVFNVGSDFSYVSSLDSCSESSVDSGLYECNLTNLSEGTHEVHVSCRDDNGNAQSIDQNTDFTFSKERSSPTISVDSPVNDSVHVDSLNVSFSIDDASSFNVTAQLIDEETSTLLDSKNWNDVFWQSFNHEFDLSTADRETILQITAIDEFNRSSSQNISFLTNSNQSHISLLDTPTLKPASSDSFFAKDTFILNLSAYFFNNLTYNLTNSSGDVISGCDVSYHNQTIINKSIGNFSCVIDSSNITDGETYVFSASASNDLFDDTFNLEKNITADLFSPVLSNDSLEHIPQSPIYDNDTITFYSAWYDENEIENVMFTYTVDSSSPTTISLEDSILNNTSSRNWAPQEKRYRTVFDIQSMTSITANSTLSYYWNVTDVAGNTNTSSSNLTTVQNRPPQLENESFSALSGYDFAQPVSFYDADVSQTNFTCQLNNTAFFNTTYDSSNSSCLIFSKPSVNTIPPGIYDLNLTVFDMKDSSLLSNDSSQVDIVVNSTSFQNISVDSEFNTPITASYYDNGSFFTQGVDSQEISSLLDQSKEYTVSFSVDHIMLKAYNISSTQQSADLFYKKYADPSSIKYEQHDLGENDSFRPVTAYALDTNLSSDEYTVEFNLSSLGVTSDDATIFHYGFLPTGINYTNTSGYGPLNTTVEGDIASASVTNFSVFVLARGVDATSSTPQNPPSNPSSPSSSSSSSSSDTTSGGGFVSSDPQPSCSDGILNQNESGIDCGGECEPCPTMTTSSSSESEEPEPSCSDSILNQGELGVDCGGPCPPCQVDQCSDGVRNGDENGVDCGGSCPPCPDDEEDKDDVVAPEKESPFSKNSSLLWIILSSFVIASLILIGVKVNSRQKSTVSPSSSPLLDYNIVHVAKVMARQHQQTNYPLKDLKEHLISHGVDKSIVLSAYTNLSEPEAIRSLVSYMQRYTSQGFESEELFNWLHSQGVSLSTLSIAYDVFTNSEDDVLKSFVTRLSKK
ncbi:MAG: fibronectin type III domain-containing protein [Nanobdellota archaeon]